MSLLFGGVGADFLEHMKAPVNCCRWYGWHIIVDEVHAFMVLSQFNPTQVDTFGMYHVSGHVSSQNGWKKSALCFSGFWHLWDYFKQGGSQNNCTDVQLTVHAA